MILNRLYELYQRKVADGSGDIAPAGWAWKEIPFVLVLNAEGGLVAIDDCRAEKKNRAQRFLVPQGVKKTSGVAANLLWDSPAYVLGYQPGKKEERLQETTQAFRDRITTMFGEEPADAGIQAVLSFLDNEPLSQVKQYEQSWEVIEQTLPFLTFRLDGDMESVARRADVIHAIDRCSPQRQAGQAQCLVTGQMASPARLHPAIKGVAGAQSAGANIVSFNEAAYESYGKSQGSNAPISQDVADAYTKALNWLLGKDSRQKLHVGDTTIVFWAQAPSVLEDTMQSFFAPPPKDNPEEGHAAFASLYEAPWKGREPHYSHETAFYVLGLSPNSSRLSIRFWMETTVAQASHHIRRYFDEIALPRWQEGAPPALRYLLRELCVQGKTDNLPPKLEGDMLQAILQGGRFPRTLLQQAVLRCRAEQNVPTGRAAWIKAYLIRNTQEDYPMTLDKTNMNPAYVLGRLFAVLERIQKEANPGLNATIRDRYYGAASTRPAATFPLLLRLKQHHMRKLERDQSQKGAGGHFEEQLGEIMDTLGTGFPSLLSLEDQGRFALGYYQQRQTFFTKHEKASDEEADQQVA